MKKLSQKQFIRLTSAIIVGLSTTVSSSLYAQATSLGLGQSLTANQYLIPEAGDRAGCTFKGLLQTNGRFILSNNGTATYSMPAAAASVAGSKLTLQSNGNLSVLSPTNVARWNSNTANKGVVKLLIRNDGNLVLVNADNGVVWQSNTGKLECNIGRQGNQGVAGARAVVKTTNLAAGAECPGGGVAVESFSDVNANGLYDNPADNPYERRVVCNGVNGTNGANGTNGTNGTNAFNSIVMRTPITPGSASCPAGGVSIRAFQDLDRSGSFTAGDTEHFVDTVCNGITGATGATGAKGDKGDVGDKGDTGAIGAKGDKGDTGETGGKGAKGETGDTGARAVLVTHVIPAGADSICRTGGTLFSSWTDVVQDTDASGAPIFTATGSVIDFNLKEVPICNGLVGATGAKGDTGAQGVKGDTGAQGDKGDTGAKGDDGFSIATNKTPASPQECATGGHIIGIYKDLNRNGTVDATDPELSTFTTCNGLRGADGFSSLIGTQTLAAGSPECPTGGVKFNVCIDTDRNSQCNEGDGGRSSPFVCNGANAVIDMQQVSNACGGNGGVMMTSYTDMDNSNTFTGPDTNMRSNMICNGSRGAQGEQGAAGVNDVVNFENTADTAGKCGVIGALTRITTFADSNGSGQYDNGETVKGTFEFCAGDFVVSRQALFAEVAMLVSSQVHILRQELISNFTNSMTRIGFLQQELARIQTTQASEIALVASLTNELGAVSAKVEAANLLSQDILARQTLASSDLTNLESQLQAANAELQDYFSQVMQLNLIADTKATRMELEQESMLLRSQITSLSETVAALQATTNNTQSMVRRQIQYFETNLCPLGTGGTLISVCSTIDSNTCDTNKSVTSTAICNSEWQGIVISGVVKGLGANGLVLENAGIQQSVNLDFDGTNDVPFKFLVLPNQAYAITVKTLPAFTTCDVVNGSGNSGTTNVANVVVSCVTRKWTGTKTLGVAGAGTYGYATATDSNGNVYISGAAYGALDGNTNITYEETFLTKYDAAGTKQWTKLQVGYSGKSIAIDAEGNVFITGYTDRDPDGNSSGGALEALVSKYSPSGSKLWTRQIGSIDTINDTYGNSVATDSLGNVFLGGYTRGILDDNLKIGYEDFFIIKYDKNGTKIWTRQLGATNTHAHGFIVSSDSLGNVFISGIIEDWTSENMLDGQKRVSHFDVFITKFDSNGTNLWTRRFGTNQYSPSIGSSTDKQGNVYVAGSTSVGIDGNINTGWSDFFVTKFDAMGSKQWTAQLGATHRNTEGNSIATDTTGNVFVTGATDGALDGNTLKGNSDFFVTKYNALGTKQWTKQLGAYNSYTKANSVATDPTGNVFVGGYTYGNLDGNTLIGYPDAFITKFDTNGNKQ